METAEQDSNNDPLSNKEGNSKEPKEEVTFYQRAKAKRKADKAFYTENPRMSTRNKK